ncbi:MAG: branched-chain amino acid ABC transporter permease [Betaproteobacteria bacterium]|nr:branched-chain amino acid ABC transporter permease [Betaproteobacteria bacterium]
MTLPSRTTLLVVALVVVAVAAPVVLPWLKTPIIMALAYGLAVLGVIVLVRAGQVSFGHAMFFCFAGYAVAFGHRLWQLDTLSLLPLGAVAGTAFGALIGLFVVRYRGIFFGMLNLAFSMMLFAVLGKFTGITNGSDGLRFDRPQVAGAVLERDDFESVLLALSLAAAVGAGMLVMRYFRSVQGQQLAAIKTNETRLEYLGISARRVFFGGYLLSAALCGLGGSLSALAQGLVTPESGYWVRSGEFVFIAILGGAGHAVGAFVGAFVFEFTKLYLAAFLTGAWQLALGVVLIVIVFAAPSGLFGLASRWLEKRKRSARPAPLDENRPAAIEGPQ